MKKEPDNKAKIVCRIRFRRWQQSGLKQNKLMRHRMNALTKEEAHRDAQEQAARVREMNGRQKK